MRRQKKRAAVYLISTCAVLAIGGVGIATAVGSSAGSHDAIRAPVPGSAAPRLSDSAEASFSVFTEPEGNSEDIRVAEEVLRGNQDLSLDPSSVRLAQTAPNGIQVRVAGDSESICLVGRIPGQAIWGGCAATASAVNPATPVIGATAYPAGEMSHPGGKLAVDALFPNGTGNVVVENTDGTSTPLSIVNDTVAFIADQDATLTWTGPEGHAYASSLPH